MHFPYEPCTTAKGFFNSIHKDLLKTSMKVEQKRAVCNSSHRRFTLEHLCRAEEVRHRRAQNGSFSTQLKNQQTDREKWRENLDGAVVGALASWVRFHMRVDRSSPHGTGIWFFPTLQGALASSRGDAKAGIVNATLLLVYRAAKIM